MSKNPWLQLALTSAIGPVSARGLMENFGSADALVGSSHTQLVNAGLNGSVAQALLNPDESRLTAALEWLAAEDHHLLHWHDARYPPLLLELATSPPVLFVAGDPAALMQPQLAIVGSRNATANGRANAREFAHHLAKAGLTITSGLAAGIDTAAHEGALGANGVSVAVLGTGPDIVYPASNSTLARRIQHSGALVSEFPPGTPVRREHFPQRNRIISGLSLGVLAVEAGMRSGSLITARYAGEFGREVFAIPGSIHSAVSKGCHQLIRQGAKLVETSADIIEELGSLAGAACTAPAADGRSSKLPEHNDPDYAKLLCNMGHDAADIQTLAAGCGLTTGELSSMLLILELEGKVESLPGGRFQKLPGGTR
jgi:DNA processing protein